MALFISSLNSGSNGNCYYVGNEKEAVLIDAGISCREIEMRMDRLGLDLRKVKAVFVSHEHKDHIAGLRVLTKKYSIPVYITEGTQQAGRVSVDKQLLNRFRADEPVQIGRLEIRAFRKMHDAGDPHSFTITSDGIRVGVFTDIGTVCQQLVYHFKSCHAAFLEANYDEEMLMTGGYPYYLKKRISDGSGHLSNIQALELFREHRPSSLSHLILSHLSRNNNCPDLVRDLFSAHAMTTEIVVASRYKESPVYSISSTRRIREQAFTSMLPPKKQQLSLFSD